MTHEKFDINRHNSIRENIDPFGKKWIIEKQRGHNLLHAVPVPTPPNYSVPQEMAGNWTRADLLQQRIEAYLIRTWDEADEAAKKAAGKQRAAKAKAEEEAA